MFLPHSSGAAPSIWVCTPVYIYLGSYLCVCAGKPTECNPNQAYNLQPAERDPQLGLHGHPGGARSERARGQGQERLGSAVKPELRGRVGRSHARRPAAGHPHRGLPASLRERCCVTYS